MDDQSTLFENKDSSQTPAPNTSSDPLATLLNEIRNDKGEPKYKSVQDALYALKHSQEYIPSLKRELDETKAVADKVKELESTIVALTRKEPSEPSATGTLDETKVAEIVSRTIEAKTTESIRKKNVDEVVSAVAAQFGDKAEQVFYDKAKELGLSRAEMNEFAAKSPQAIFNLFGITRKTVNTEAPLKSSVNTTGMTPPESTYIKRNETGVLFGATTEELMQERDASAKLVDELHSKGKTIADLTNPKEYFKHFGRG
jgi:hypothetical protein